MGALGSLAGALFLAGCGGQAGRSEVAKVKCTVTVNGEALATGSIMFTPDSKAGTKGRAATGAIKNGKVESLTCYEPGDGAIVGKHKVSITLAKTLAPGEPPPLPGSVPAARGQGQTIPEEYNERTKLEATVEADKVNEFSFDLAIPGFKAP